MLVAVVLVNWCRADDTLECIKSLLALERSDIDMDIVVCDNHSPKSGYDEIISGLSQILPKESRKDIDSRTVVYDYPFFKPNGSTRPIQILVARTPENLGFAGGNNFAVEKHDKAMSSPVDYYWFLNNDTEVDPQALSHLVQKVRGRPDYGICGSTMVYAHDRATVQALGGSTYEKWSGTMREIGNGQPLSTEIDEAGTERRMRYVCGASMFVCSELLLRIGKMREDYFLFFEEIDWCERARRAGYSLAYASKALVFHKEGAAIGTGTGARRSLLAEYYGVRNKLKVTWRFYPFAFPTVWLTSWLQVLRRLLQRRPAHAVLMARVLCGFGKRPV